MKCFSLRAAMLVIAATAPILPGLAQEATVTTIELSSRLSLDGIVVSANGVLYGAQGFNGFRIHEVSLDGTSEQVVTSLNGPIDMDFDSTGALYVTTFNDAGLFLANPDDGTFERIATVNSGPSGIAIDRRRHIAYVSHYGTGPVGNGTTIFAIDLATRERTVFSEGNGLLGVVSLAVDEDGNLYAANISNAKIFRITPEGDQTEIVVLPRLSVQAFYVGHVAWARGGLYVTGNANMAYVYRVEMDGSFEIIAGTGKKGSEDGAALEATFNGPNGIAASVTGDSLFVSELNNPGAIRVISLPAVETGSRDEGVPASGYTLGQTHPNPFIAGGAATVTINYTTPSTAHVRIGLHDILGRTLQIVETTNATAGHHSVELDVSQLPSGLYVYTLETGTIRLARSLMVVR